ncbi:UDP-forming cellulose synthase catalytic subunit [Psychromonas arctica]|uniref:UDP-forming cellulose synthase catalytic subunit n=1 Tax=Psychromonas arctica TaxID=168275 RepID=UPI002FD5144D
MATKKSTSPLLQRLKSTMPKLTLKLLTLVTLFLLIALASIPLHAASQLALSMGVIVFVYTASSEAIQHSKKRELFRLFAIIIGCLLSLRYLIWRGVNTLESDDIFSFIAMLMLFMAEIYSGIIHLLGCFVNIFPLNRPRQSIKQFKTEQIPTVDLVIPSYNESEDLLEVTIRAAMMLDYPTEKLKIHLLDDGGTDQKVFQENAVAGQQALTRRKTLQALCQSLGAEYHTREKNEHAKAGNINSALLNMNGELVVILDADHVPTTDFLDRTAPWMIKDEKVFLVQSPHFMDNPDPIERNYFSAFTRMPSENDMFYNTIQKGLDFWSASFFCGSAAVLRRRHLDLVGGIAGDSITEDAETALELHALGYKSVYVEKPMISGLATESFSSFIQQRERWAQGMAQILILKKPFLNSGLSWYQKCGYMSSILFWFFPFARLVFLLSPLGYLLFGLELIHATFTEILIYTVPHIIVSFRLSHVLFGKNRWPLVSELYEILQCTFLFRALITVIKNPNDPSFLVTPKGEDQSKTYISSLANSFYWLLAMLFIGNLGAIYHFYNTPESWELTFVVFAWNAFNFILCVSLLDVLIEKKQVRKASRLPAYDEVQIVISEQQTWQGNLRNLSRTGANLTLKFEQALPEEICLIGYSNALNKRVKIACQVMYQNKESNEVRLQFLTRNDQEKNNVIAYTLCDSERWDSFQKRRTRPISYFYGLKHVVSVSMKPLFLHIYMKLKQRS